MASGNFRVARRNPWYLLATITGEPKGEGRSGIEYRNAEIWNWYVGKYLTDSQKQHILLNDLLGDYEDCDLEEREFKKLWHERVTQAGLGEDMYPPELDMPGEAKGRPSRHIDFSGLKIGGISFNGFIIPRRVSFSGSKFLDDVEFNSSLFLNEADFKNTAFSRVVGICNATFLMDAWFNGTIFSDGIHATDAKFDSRLIFKEAHVKDISEINFATFSKDAIFEGASFDRSISFEGARFLGECIFINANFSSTTNFDQAQFSRPPKFHGSHMHPDTIWPSEEGAWPGVPRKYKAKDAESAWSSLKWAMNQVQKHDAELDFFAKELEAKRVNLKWPKTWVIDLYRVFSDYGRSALRPFLWWWIITLFAYTINCISLSRIPNLISISYLESAMVFTLGNAFSLGGLLSNPVRETHVSKMISAAGGMAEIPFPIELLSLVHSIASLLFIFLIGLALRNRLRIK